MKVHLMTLAALLCCTMSLLTACSSDDDIKVGVLHVNINPAKAYLKMDYLDEASSFLKKQTLGVDLLLYDGENKLVWKDVTNFQQLALMSVDVPNLKKGYYTLVAVQQIYSENNQGLWMLEDEESLTTFRVMSERFPLPDYALLAIDRQPVAIDGDATINVTPQSMGSIVTFAYNGLPDHIECEEVFLSTTNRARGLWMDPARSGDEQLWRDEDAAEGLPYYLAQIVGEEGHRPPESSRQAVFTIDRGTQQTGMGFTDDYYLEDTRVDFHFEPWQHYYFIYSFSQPEGQRWSCGTGKLLQR